MTKQNNNNAKFKLTKKKKRSVFEIIMIGLMIAAALVMSLSMFFI